MSTLVKYSALALNSWIVSPIKAVEDIYGIKWPNLERDSFHKPPQRDIVGFMASAAW